jgi:hypothetical protein
MPYQHQQRCQTYAQYGPSNLGRLWPNSIFDSFKATKGRLLVNITREPEKARSTDSAALQSIFKEFNHFERGSSQNWKVERCVIVILVFVLVLDDVVVATVEVVVEGDGWVVAPIERSMDYAWLIIRSLKLLQVVFGHVTVGFDCFHICIVAGTVKLPAHVRVWHDA